MRYVVVLVAEIEEQGQLAETVQAINDAGIPHLEQHLYVGDENVAERVLAEFA